MIKPVHKRSSRAGLAVTAVLLLLPLHGLAADPQCLGIDLKMLYAPTNVTMTLGIDARTCGSPQEIGPIRIEGSLSRNTVTTYSPRTGVEFCDPSTACAFTLTVPHPNIEIAVGYFGYVSWRSTGPGPELTYGSGSIEMGCTIATTATRIC